MTLNNQSLNLNARQILIKRLSTLEALEYVGPLGELVIDTNLKQLRIQDGTTPGGMLSPTSATIANLQQQINRIVSNNDTSAIDSLTEIVANVNALIANKNESSLVNSGFYANLTSTGNLVIDGHFLPKTHLAQDLGSRTRAWRDLYISNATAYFGNAALTITNNGLTLISNGRPLPFIGNIRFPDGSVQSTALTQSTLSDIDTILSANLSTIRTDLANTVSYFETVVDNIVANIDSAPKDWTNPITANSWSIIDSHGGIRVTNIGFSTGLEKQLTTGRAANEMDEYDSSDNTVSVIRVNRSEFPDLNKLITGFESETLINANVLIDITTVGAISIDRDGDFFVITLAESIPAFANSTPFTLTYDTTSTGIPVAWFDVNNVATGAVNFRGAVINYHALSEDSGTLVGTINMSNNNGGTFVTHSESGSGVTTLYNNILWGRFGSDGNKLYYYRTDGIESAISIHWVAKLFYGADYLE